MLTSPRIGIDIKLAARLLKEGRLVGMPTETVYGLAADASNAEALNRLFEAKGRPRNHPVIVHLASAEHLRLWVKSVPPIAEQLARNFWPGPLTLILPKAEHVLPEVTGGQDTVAIRVPNHPLALDLLEEFGGGLAAPSANRFGKLSPTQAHDVADEFGDEVSYILDGGKCQVGIESTILDLSSKTPRILRPGMLSEHDLEPVLTAQKQRPDFKESKVAGNAVFSRESKGCSVDADQSSLNEQGQAQVRAPGTLKSHYSPRTPLRLVASEELFDVLKETKDNNRKVAVLAFQTMSDWSKQFESSPAGSARNERTAESAGTDTGSSGNTPALENESLDWNITAWIVVEKDPRRYARSLYSNLRKLDACRCDWIIVESPPEAYNWDGIRDRLKRASYRET